MAKPPITRAHSAKNTVFQYEGIDKKNNRLTGEITAVSLPKARAILKDQGITVIKLKKKTLSFFKWGSGKVKAEDITMFTRQMSTMLSAGIPLVQGLGVISEGASSGALGDLTRKIKLDVESGSAFSIALKKNPQYFDELFCSLVESGEQSGTLDTMLNRIAVYKEKTDSLKRKIKKAMYYPAAVVIIASIVTAILLIKVVPTFKDLFKGYGAELPGFTQFVLSISEFLQSYGLYFMGGLIIFLVVLVHLHRSRPEFQHFTQRLSLRLPVFGNIIRKSIIARFARTLSTTSAAGVPLTDALDSVAKASANIVYTDAIKKIREGLATGQQMRPTMKRTGVFPAMVVQMVGIGEESGALEDMLGKVATIYEEEVDTAVDGLTTLLEPLIMVFLGVVVGGLVIAMYLPIFKMGSIL
jgi:type IV pilus assembly protein PilC